MEEQPNQESRKIVVSKYARPIEFIPKSTRDVQETAMKKTNGDEVASMYRSIISLPSNRTAGDCTLYNKNGTCTRKEEDVMTADADDKGVWCESCEVVVLQSDYKRHIQGTAHMVTSHSNIPAPDILTLTGKNIGFKMLQSQGWKYEDGLGPNGQGRRLPIATVFKQDRLCIGHQKRGPKMVTHKYAEIERITLDRIRKERSQQKDPGKEIAKKAKAESRSRVALLHYLKE